MSIRLAQVTDIPVLKELLNQIFQVHQTVRPDLFKNTDKGSKYSETELKELLQDESKPIFVYTDGKNRVLGHLFLVIKETEGLLILRRIQKKRRKQIPLQKQHLSLI